MLGVNVMRRRAPRILHLGGGVGKGAGYLDGWRGRPSGAILLSRRTSTAFRPSVTYASSDLLYGAQTRSTSTHFPRVVASAVLVAVGYYLGAKLGFALTLRPQPI